jgi:hypothetical protein
MIAHLDIQPTTADDQAKSADRESALLVEVEADM